MVVPRLQKIGLDCGQEHENQLWGRAGAFGRLLGLPGGPLGRFLVPRGSFWGAFWSPGEPLGVDFDPLGSLRDHCWVTFSIFVSAVVADSPKRFAILKTHLFQRCRCINVG